MEKVKTTRFDGVIIDTPPLPVGEYRVIYADPSWNFRTYSKKNQTRAAENHYPIMTLEDIKALPVSEVAHPEGSALFLWVTDPMLRQGLEVMEAWGYEYRTVAFTWVKTNRLPKRKKNLTGRFLMFWDDILYDAKTFFMGMGYWTRGNPEMCLLGVRGKSPKRKNKNVRQLVVAPRREHSRKPDEVYDRIESLLDGPYLEMFARTRRNDGWTVWGAEIGKFEAIGCEA